MMENPTLLKKMGKAGRQRAVDVFSWTSIAKQNFKLYQSLIK